MDKTQSIAVENLALELTRKCNLHCGHCLRGQCEDKEMSDETLDRIFEEISMVGLLNFIGGESSLATNRINQLVETIPEVSDFEISSQELENSYYNSI